VLLNRKSHNHSKQFTKIFKITFAHTFPLCSAKKQTNTMKEVEKKTKGRAKQKERRKTNKQKTYHFKGLKPSLLHHYL